MDQYQWIIIHGYEWILMKLLEWMMISDWLERMNYDHEWVNP